MRRPLLARPVWSALARVWDHLFDHPAGFTSPPPSPESLPARLNLLPLEERVVPDGRPLPVPLLFTATGSGAPPRVTAHRADTGELAFERQPFEAAFAGGVRVAAGDINHDGWPDLIAAAGPGGGPRVVVLDGKTGDPVAGPLGSFYAYDESFSGGVWVASGDVDGDGWADVITGAGAGGGPHVKVFSGRTGGVIASFYAYAPDFQGGATIAAVDLTGDGKADVVTGAGPGGGPHVKVFDLNAAGGPAEVRSFYAFDPSFAGGVEVGGDVLAGDVTGDGVADLVVGRGAGAASRVRVFDGATGKLYAEFAPFGDATAGVRTATAFVNDDRYADVIVGTGAGPTAQVRVFDGRTLAELPAPLSGYTPFGAGYTGGVYVAASNDPPTDPVYANFGGYSQNPVPASSSFTISVNVNDADSSNGLQTPTGTVTFTRVGVGTLGTATVAPNGTGQGVAVLTVPAYTLPPGTYGGGGYGGWLSWSYSGDARFYGASGYGSPLTVSPPPPPPLPQVWAEPWHHASEKGPTEGRVRFHRTIPNPAADTGLSVDYDLGGTATPLVDHPLAGGTHTVTFPAGSDTFTLGVTPYADGIADPGEYVRFRLKDAAAYTVISTQRSADVFIEDDQSSDRVGPTCGECDAGSPVAPLGGADTGGSQKLSSGVRTDGRVRVNLADAGGERTGGVLGGVLQWTNAYGYSDLFGGPGTKLADVPRLLGDGAGGLVLTDGGYSGIPFVPAGGGFAPRFGGPATLAAPGVDTYRVTDGAGNTLDFYSYHFTVPFHKQGRLRSCTDAAGRTTTLTYADEAVEWSHMGVPKTVAWNDPANGVTETVEIRMEILTDPAGDRHPRVTGFTRSRGPGVVEVLGIGYRFRPVTSPAPGELQYMAVPKGTTRTVYPDYLTGQVVGETYTRFYQAGEANGYEDGLKFQLGEKAVARLRAAYPSVTDLDTLSDAQVAPYADLRLEYDAQRRVSKIVRAGEGCSACAGGLGGATLTYTASGNSPGVNTWATKTTETLDDGTVNAVYANAWGQTLLTATAEAGTGKTWLTYTRYDAAYHPVLVASPSAVSGYSDALPDLVGYSGGNAAYLRDAAGLVQVFAYPAATTATDTAAGGVAWLAASGWVQNGEFGSGVKQWERAYVARTAGGFSTYHLAADTRYRNDDGTGGQTTAYAYTWVSGTHHADTVTTTLPAVTAAQNGPGGAASVTWVVNTDDQVVWAKDAAGYLTHYQYDPNSGGLVKAVFDVNTAAPYDYTGLPAGWSTPTGGGLHQLSGYEVDAFGRTTKATDPLGRVTYAVYKDAAHEVRTYRGWDGSQPTGPIEVYREDWGRGYAEWLTMSAYATVIGGVPVGTESISGIQSLARASTNPAGQTVAADAYFDLSGVTYSQAATLGTAGVNYLHTDYGYDKRGWPNKEVGPDGVIHRTVYDALGRPVSAWVGTNDTPASGYWGPSNPAGMTQLVAAEYDGGGVGDSNLTATTVYPGHGRAARTTATAYDWRNRPVAVKEAVEAGEGEAVNRPLTRYAYDNLGEVLTASVYDGDTVAVGATPASSRLRALTAFSYDEYGRAYRTDSYGVNQTTGVPASAPLTEQAWYDVRGLAGKTQAADGRVVKWQYDGLGRPTATFLTDGAGDANWTDAMGVADDTVWAQSETVYDMADQVLQVNARERAYGETGAGPLGTPTAGVKARVTSAGWYYDLLGRTTDAVSVGTNGGAAWVRPASVPARSNTALVTSVSYGANGLPQDVTDPRGIVARTAYDLLGRVTSSTAAYGTGDALTATASYDSAGRLLAVTAPGGRTTRYGYDTWGRASSVTERYGTAFARTSTVALDDIGGALTATDPLGTVTAFTENVRGQVVSVTAASGTALARTASATFDVFGRTLTTTDPRSFVTSYAYDDVNRAVTLTDAAGYAWTTTFDMAGRVSTASDPFGNTTSVGYDLPGRVVSVTDPLGHTTISQHNVYSTEDHTVDPLGHTTRTIYDNFGRTASVLDPLGNTTAFSYDRNSNLASVMDAKGVTTAFTYDNLDRTTSVTEAVGKSEERTTNYAYSSAGDLASVTDPLGRQTTFAYDAAGRMTGQTLAANKSEAFTVSVGYDLLDRVVSVTKPGSRTTGYTYDALSQLTKVTEAVGTSLERNTTFGYDNAGNRTSVTDPLGYTTAYAFDGLNRVTGVTDANGGLVQIAYDKAGRTSSLTDPTGNVTGWGYDAAGRRISETDPRGKTTTYAYDNADRLVSVTDRIGRVREFGYDDADRMTSETWKVGGSTVQTQTFGYDAVGNPTSATDPDGSYTLTYDNLNRVVQAAGPWGVTQTFGYDAADNRTSTSDNQGGSSTSTYDNLNRLTSRTQSATGMTSVRADWGYDAKGDQTTEARAVWSSGWVGAGTTARTYDDLGRLVGIDHKNAAGTSVGTYAYTFDAGDRLTGETFNGASKTYAYDKLGQLTNDNGTVYTYDASGNRTGGGYVTGTGNRTTSDGTWTYTYDDAGQLTGKSKSGEAWAYTYDFRGQMTSASKSASPGGTVTDSVSYKVDAWGNRIGRDQSGTTTSTQRYVVDGWDPAKAGAVGTENFDAVMDLDGSNAVTGRRLFGGGFDSVAARQDAGGGVTWYGADGLGSVRQVFDNSGNTTGSRAFTGFGAVTATSGTGQDRYAYSGTATDPLTGLVGDDARQYDPTLGKWTSDDPIGFAGGDYNVGRYAGNRATTGSDPSGLEPPKSVGWSSITDWMADQTKGQSDWVHVPAVFGSALIRNLDVSRHVGGAVAEAVTGNPRPLLVMGSGYDSIQMSADYAAGRARGDNVAAAASMALIRNTVITAPFLGFGEAAEGRHIGGVNHHQPFTEDQIAEKYTGGLIATFSTAYGAPKGMLGRTKCLKGTTGATPALPAAEVTTTQVEQVMVNGKETSVLVSRITVKRASDGVPPTLPQAATGGASGGALPRAATLEGTRPLAPSLGATAQESSLVAVSEERAAAGPQLTQRACEAPTAGGRGFICDKGCVYTADGTRIGNFLEDPSILSRVRAEDIVYVTNLEERAALRAALRERPNLGMPELRHLTVDEAGGGVVTAASQHLAPGNRGVTSHVIILPRQNIAGHQVEVHVGATHSPHVHIGRGTKSEQYISLSDPDWYNQLPRRVRENQRVMDAIHEAAFYGLRYPANRGKAP